MENNINEKSFNLGRLILMLCMILVVVVGGTFAWLTYSSKESALVLTIGNINDTQIKLSPYEITGTMTPSNTYTGGVYSEVEVSKGNNNATSFALFYKINDLDVALINNGLSYTVVNTETNQTVKTGKFKDLIDTSKPLPEEVIILDTNTDASLSANTSIYYKVYLWVDSSVGNQNAIQNATLDVELNGSIGSVQISGDSAYGSTLTSIVNDAIVDDTTTYSYQWYYNDSANTTGGTKISGATSSTYTVGKESVDKYVYLVVTTSKGKTLSNVVSTQVAKKQINVASLTYSPLTKTYNGNTSAPSGFSITATAASGLINNDTVTVNYTGAVYNSANVTEASKITVSGISLSGTNASYYSLSATSYEKSGATITPKVLNIGNYTDTYNATTTFVRTYSTGIGSETLTLTYKPSTKNVVSTGYAYATSAGSGKYTVTKADGTGKASNYNITAGGTFTINQKTLAVASFTYSPLTKTYDGNTSAPSGFKVTATAASGLISGDTLTVNYTGAVYNSAAVADANKITVSGMSLSGTDAGNYKLDATSYAKSGATITNLGATVTAGSTSKTYDGSALTTNACTVTGLVSGHTVTCTMTSASTITDAGSQTNTINTVTIMSGTTNVTANYTITKKTGTLTVNPKNLSLGNHSDTYNGTTSYSRTFSTGVGSENIALTYKPYSKNVGSYTYATSAGSGKYTVTKANGTGKANNYNITSGGTFTISKRTLTPSVTASNKTYDGTVTATCSVTLATVLSGDTVTASATGAFDNKNVGTGKTVTCSSITLSGASAGNYSLNATSKTTTANITAKALTITAKAQTVTYGTAISTGTSQVTTSGLVSGDALTSITLTPSTTNYVTNGTITPSAAVVKNNNGSGSDVTGNYSITYTAGKLVINKKALTITAKDQTVTYGTAITKTTAQVTVSGLVSGDSLTGITLTQSTTNVTTNGTITPSAAVVKNSGGTNVSGSYTITYNTGKLIINPKSIAASGITVTLNPTSYTYDGNAKKPAVTVKDGSTTLTGINNLLPEMTSPAYATYSNFKLNFNAAAANDNPGSQSIKFQFYNGSTYLSQPFTKTAVGKYTYTFTKDSTFNRIRLGMNGNKADANVYFDVSGLTNGTSYTFSFNITRYATYDVDIEEIMLYPANATASYVVSYMDNVNASTTAKVQVAGLNNYNSSTIKNFTINKRNCSCTISEYPTGLKFPESKTGDIKYSCTAGGTLNVTSGTTSVLTVGTVGSTSTPLTAVGIGSSTITVGRSADTNTNACSVSQAVSVAASQYNISYSCGTGLGSAPSSHTATYGQNFTLATATCTKKGYTFNKWTTNSNETYDGHGWSSGYSNKWTYANGQNGIANNKLVLYPSWTANSYTVTADSQGGTIPTTSGWTIASDSTTATKSLSFGSTYGTLPTPNNKRGYTFSGWSLVPDGYQQVEYIQSSGSQYIDTGYYWKNEKTEIYFDGTVITNGSSQSLFGNEEYIDATNRYFAGIPHGSNGSYAIYLGDGSQGSVSTTVGTRFNMNIITTADKKLSVYKDGKVVIANKTYSGSVITKTNASLTSSTSKTVGHIFLFANHNTSRGATDEAIQNVSAMRVYSFKLYDNGTLVRNLIPCYRKSDNVVGMFDTVEGKFYTTPTGSFTKGSNVSNITSSSIVSIDANHKIYTQWTPITYTINYVVPSGWTAVNSHTCTYGQTCTINKYSYENSTKYFSAWSSPGKNGTGTDTSWTNWSGTWSYIDGEYGITNKVLTLTAVSGDFYTINFNANGGSGSKTSITKIKVGSSVSIPNVADSSAIFTRTGYNFAGWSTKTDSTDDGYGWTGWSGTWGEWNNKYGVSNFTLNLYARWTPITYTISYVLNGGTNPSSGVVTSYNIQTATFNLPSPTKTGYSFKGWYTSSSFSGSAVTQITKGTTGNKTFYAKWVDDIAPTVPTYTAFYSADNKNYTSGTWAGKDDYIYTTLSSTDKGSGVSYMQYCEYVPSTSACGSWTTFSFSISGGLTAADTNGTRTGTEPWGVRQRNQYYKFRACDVDGNCSAATSTPYNIRYDLTPPSISYSAFYANGSGAYTSGQTASSEVHTTITAKDNEVGTITKIQYTANANATAESSEWQTLNLAISGGIKANTDGSYYGTESWTFYAGRNETFYFRACDSLGNCSAKSSKYNIVYVSGLSGSVKITGTNTYNQTLTASVTNTDSATLKYQWYYNSSNSTSGGDEINGATSSTYKIGSGLAGKYIYVEVTATKDGYNEAKWYDATDATNNSTATVQKASISPTVSMSGYTYGGTKSTPSVSGNSGSGNVTYYYNTSNSNSGGTAWSGVTSATSLNAGTYYMYATVAESTNYKSATTPAVAFTISKATGYVNLSATSGTSEAGAASKTFTISSHHGGKLSVTDDNGTATVSVSGSTVTVSGLGSLAYGTEVKVTVTSAATTNYNAASATYTLTIKDTGKPVVSGVTYTSNLFPTKSVSTYNVMSANASDATKLSTTGTDPFIVFSSLAITDITKAIVTFDSGVSSAFVLQIFYATSGTAFSEANSVSVNVVAGAKVVEATLPGGTYTAIRFDFGSASGKTFDLMGIDLVGKNISNNNYVHANITDAGKVSSYTVTTSNSTPSSFTNITDVTSYHVRYQASTTATATYYVWGKDVAGNVSNPGSVSASKTLLDKMITLGTTSYTYDGNAKQPTVTVKDGQTTLTNGTHYTVSYSNNTNAGTATATVTGKGLYSGTINKTFTINKKTGYVNLAATSGTSEMGTASKTFTISSHHGGTLSVSDNNNTASATVSGTTVTVSGLSGLAHNTVVKITVESKATTNYTAATATYTLTIKDTVAPTCSLSSTTNVKATTQTVTATIDKGAGTALSLYYWGTSSSGTPSNAASASLSLTTSSSGENYLRVSDAAGNVGDCDITMVSYTVQNRLLTRSGKKNQYNTTNYELKSTHTYLIPDNTWLSRSNSMTVPTNGDSNSYAASLYTDVSEIPSTGTATTITSEESKITTTNDVLVLWINRIVYTITYRLGNGTNSATSYTDIGTRECRSGGNYTLNTVADYGGTLAEGYGNTDWAYAGWNESSSGKSVQYNSTITCSKNISLYAIYSRTIPFYSGVDGATVNNVTQYLNPVSPSYVSSVTVPSAASISGWTFTGYDGSTGSGVAVGGKISISISLDSSQVGTTITPNSGYYSSVYEKQYSYRAVYQRNLTIKYNANTTASITGTVPDDTKIQYYKSGTGVTDPDFELVVDTETTGFQRKGYHVGCWNADSSVTSCGTGGDGDLNISVGVGGFVGGVWIPSVDDTTTTKTYYAIWEANTLTVSYNVNRGTITSSTTSSGGVTSSYTLDSEGNIYKDGVLRTNKLEYGKSLTTDGLPNYNHYQGMEIYWDGRDAVSGKEWLCLDGCDTADATFSDTTQYSANQICNIDYKSCYVTLGPNWENYIDWDFNISGSFSTNQYANTGRVLNWDKTFMIRVVFNSPTASAGKRRLIIGSYKGSNVKDLNIEINASNKLRVYYDSGAVDKTSSGSVASGEDVTMTFIWIADRHRYIVTAVGATTNIYMEGLHEVSGTATNSLRVGARDLRESDGTFSPMTVRSVHHGRSYVSALGSTLSSPYYSTGTQTFTGWYPSNDDNATQVAGGDTVSGIENVYYARWAGVGQVKVYYSPNGGTLLTPTTSSSGTVYNWTTNSSGRILRNGSLLTTSIYYGQQTTSSGLANWDNDEALSISNDGKVAKSGAEWVCLSGCTTANKTFADTKVYSASDFCDASTGDCTVVVGVNWTNEVNASRFICEGTNKLAKYYVTTCTDAGVCSYTKKNGIPLGDYTTANWNDVEANGKPSGSFNQLNYTLWTTVGNTHSISNTNSTCTRKKVTITADSGLNCREAAKTGGELKRGFLKNATVTAWRSTTQFLGTSYYYYYNHNYTCWMSAQYLSVASYSGGVNATYSGKCRCANSSGTVTSYSCSSNSLATTTACSNYCSDQSLTLSSSSCSLKYYVE